MNHFDLISLSLVSFTFSILKVMKDGAISSYEAPLQGQRYLKYILSVVFHIEISTYKFYCMQKGDLSFVARLYIPVLFLLLFAWYPIMAQPRVPHTSHPECPKSSTLHGYDQKRQGLLIDSVNSRRTRRWLHTTRCTKSEISISRSIFILIFKLWCSWDLFYLTLWRLRLITVSTVIGCPKWTAMYICSIARSTIYMRV